MKCIQIWTRATTYLKMPPAKSNKLPRNCSKNHKNIYYNIIENDRDHRNSNIRKRRNIDISRQHNVPTIHPQLRVAKIGDIYRSQTSLAPVYLRNAQDYDDAIQIHANQCAGGVGGGQKRNSDTGKPRIYIKTKYKT